MIEMAQLDELVVRVTGIRRFDRNGRAAFSLVVLVPGSSASDALTLLLARQHITLKLYLADGEFETLPVAVIAHDVRLAGHPNAPIHRHHIELEQQQPGEAPEPNEIETELAVILAQLDRLIDALDRAGLVRRQVVTSQWDTLRNTE